MKLATTYSLTSLPMLSPVCQTVSMSTDPSRGFASGGNQRCAASTIAYAGLFWTLSPIAVPTAGLDTVVKIERTDAAI